MKLSLVCISYPKPAELIDPSYSAEKVAKRNEVYYAKYPQDIQRVRSLLHCSLPVYPDHRPHIGSRYSQLLREQ
jgi:hypothetical protein